METHWKRIIHYTDLGLNSDIAIKMGSVIEWMINKIQFPKQISEYLKMNSNGRRIFI